MSSPGRPERMAPGWDRTEGRGSAPSPAHGSPSGEGHCRRQTWLGRVPPPPGTTGDDPWLTILAEIHAEPGQEDVSGAAATR